MNTPASGTGFFERIVAHELGVPARGQAPSLRAQLPYPFEAMRSHEPEPRFDVPVAAAPTVPASDPVRENRQRAAAGPDIAPFSSANSVLTTVVQRHGEPVVAPPAPICAEPAAMRVEHFVRESPHAMASSRHEMRPATAEPAMAPVRPPHVKAEPIKAPIPSSHTATLPDTRSVAAAAPASGATSALRPASSMAHAPLAPQATTSEPVIEIHIGRLEVRAQPPHANSAPPSRMPPPKDDRLSEYLGRRGRGARS